MLFKAKKLYETTGLKELIKKLEDMGLSHFLDLKTVSQSLLGKGKEKSPLKTETISEESKNPWYYLGP
jgi:hypothetical protein